MIKAAVKLYHKLERNDVNALLLASTGELRQIPSKQGKSNDVWFWAMRRWGNRFAELEYDMRGGK